MVIRLGGGGERVGMGGREGTKIRGKGGLEGGMERAGWVVTTNTL